MASCLIGCCSRNVVRGLMRNSLKRSALFSAPIAHVTLTRLARLSSRAQPRARSHGRRRPRQAGEVGLNAVNWTLGGGVAKSLSFSGPGCHAFPQRGQCAAGSRRSAATSRCGVRVADAGLAGLAGVDAAATASSSLFRTRPSGRQRAAAWPPPWAAETFTTWPSVALACGQCSPTGESAACSHRPRPAYPRTDPDGRCPRTCSAFRRQERAAVISACKS